MKSKVFFIDPQTLSMYDYELLSRMKNNSIYLFGSKAYNYIPLNNIICKFWFSYYSYNNSIFKGLSYVLTMFHILFYIFTNKPDVIHIQWIRIPIFDYFYYSFLRKCLNIKLVYTVHNILPHSIKKGDYNRYRRMYRLCDALIVHTKTTKEELVRDFFINPDIIFIAPIGPYKFNISEADIEEELNKINKKYNLKDKIIFSILGVQSEYKGTDLLINGWLNSIKLKTNNNIALIVAGINSLNFNKSKTDNIIVIDGLLSDLTFKALIRRTDVIILPYRRIEQSGVLLSIVTERKPYCATEVGELTIPIKQENIGWIIPEVSSDSIKKTLEEIIDNPKEIKEKVNNEEGWEHINNFYDWNNSAAITEKIYTDFCK